MLSVIIPAFNESKNIKPTIEEIKGVIRKLNNIKDFEIIVVDDHSNDDTFDIVKSLNDIRINCIRLSRRSGSHSAIRAGIEYVRGNAVLCIAADGQDDPNLLHEILKKWEDGSNIVWALRKKRRESILAKLFAILFYRLLKRATNLSKKIDLSKADFFLLDEKVVKAIKSCPERNTSLFGLLVWLGFKQDSVEYNRRERRFGYSKWNFKSRLWLAKDWIIAFSGLPLKMTTVIGLIVASIGFLYALFIVIYSLMGNPVKGWPSTIVVVLVLGGLQMIMLGIVGEYLWRNLDESRKRPLFFIEKSTIKKKLSK